MTEQEKKFIEIVKMLEDSGFIYNLSVAFISEEHEHNVRLDCKNAMNLVGGYTKIIKNSGDILIRKGDDLVMNPNNMKLKKVGTDKAMLTRDINIIAHSAQALASLLTWNEENIGVILHQLSKINDSIDDTIITNTQVN